MTTVLEIAEAFRSVLVPFLRGATAFLVFLVVLVCVQRVVRDRLARRHERLTLAYQPDLDHAVNGSDSGAPARLVQSPRRHRHAIGVQLIGMLRAFAGPAIGRARGLAQSLGCTERWRLDLGSWRWWRRAEGARSLGVIQERSTLDAIVPLLDDRHPEVRAAAIEALGAMQDPRAVPALLATLHAQAGHQRVRIIDALKRIGDPAGPEVLAYVRSHVAAFPELADLLVISCGAAAADDLLAWLRHGDPQVRRAAFQALGTIGVSERAFYFFLQALGDADSAVRAAAARGLGRSGRADAAGYLASCLDDEWEVAASGARALGRLAPSGHAELQRISKGSGQSAGLARQILFELGLPTSA